MNAIIAPSNLGDRLFELAALRPSPEERGKDPKELCASGFDRAHGLRPALQQERDRFQDVVGRRGALNDDIGARYDELVIPLVWGEPDDRRVRQRATEQSDEDGGGEVLDLVIDDD